MLLSSTFTGIEATPDRNRKKREAPDAPPHVVRPKAVWGGKVKARRRLQREFFHWLAANRERFSIGLRIEKRTDRVVAWSFHGINPVISGVLSHDISIFAGDGDDWWDIIADFWAQPKKVEGGYIDVSLLKEYQRLVPDRQKLWRDGIFEPFIEWVNETLAKAQQLEVLEGLAGWSNARLLMDRNHRDGVEFLRKEDNPAVIKTILPVRV